MITRHPMLSLLALFGLASCGHAAGNPDALARSLQKAMTAGDFELARSLADIGGAPADLHFAYFDAVLECANGSKCAVTTAPLDAEFRQNLTDDAAKEGALAPAAEGVIVVSHRADDGSESGTLKMPYAKSGRDYKIAALHLTDAEIAKRRATRSEDVAAKMLAGGIYDNASRTRRTDWPSAATKLPAGGGAPGAAYLKQTAAMAAAVDANDPDAAMRSGGRWAELVFADQSYDGKPVAREFRQKKLKVQSLRMLRDVKIAGGYQLGDDAVLVVEARNGIGWTERGAVLISRDGDNWDVSGKDTVSFPN